MKNQVIYTGGLLLAISWLVVYYFLFILNGASANPDYICYKNVGGQPCRIHSCGAWTASHKRTCTGVKTTQVAYLLARTNCEAGYTKIFRSHGSVSASGRQGANYISNQVACSIVQTDNIAPIGRTY